MTKTLDEKLAELNDRPVPDETLTKAWWDLGTRKVEEDEAQQLPKTEPGGKERFEATFKSMVPRRT